MTNLKFNSLGKLGTVIIMGLTVLGMSACSTTSATMAAQGAPITYKVDQGAYQQALIKAPYSNILPETHQMPRSVMPQTHTPTEPNAQPGLPQVTFPKVNAPKFNMKNVDTDLYAYQRVGKPYTIMGKRYTPKHQPKYDKVGTASWYGPKFHGKLTANGEKYDMNGITAAHKTLPLNSMVLVTNVENGKSMNVRVNDRGPFVSNRIIDLSRAVATELGLFNSGLGKVRVQYAGPADPNAHKMAKRPNLPKAISKALPKARLDKVPAPEQVAQVPQYKPLRDLGTPPAAPVSQPLLQQQQPQPQLRFPFEPQPNTPRPQALIPQPSLPYIAPKNVEVPNAPTGNLEDGPVTLTIKGPIHMAADKNDGSFEQPKFIPAVNYTHLPVGK